MKGEWLRVRCLDNALQRDVLSVGKVYTAWDETEDCYVLDGLGPFTKERFEVVDKVRLSDG